VVQKNGKNGQLPGWHYAVSSSSTDERKICAFLLKKDEWYSVAV
jgi:hypothetical protein